jgi:D-arabinose 1-dehydrogenase
MTKDYLQPLKNHEEKSFSLQNLPDVILGAGVFNYQYTDSPHDLSAVAVVRRAFELGIRALDTSAYYGPSEIIIGDALEKLRHEYPRDSYMICTKAGRVSVDEFDYSANHIRFSVKRSLQRLKTSYLDVLYIHDVEFVTTDGCLEAIAEALKMKAEGLIRNVGISGYPVDYLLYLSKKVLSILNVPLDVVLSYSNFCIQNTKLEKYQERFYQEAKVTKVLNASPLSMSLLRSQITHSFHPAPYELRTAVEKASEYCSSRGVELADIASRFALRNWNGPTVFGLSNVAEVEQAVRTYWQSKDVVSASHDEPLVEGVRKILGATIDLTWPSGIKHPDMNP